MEEKEQPNQLNELNHADLDVIRNFIVANEEFSDLRETLIKVCQRRLASDDATTDP